MTKTMKVLGSGCANCQTTPKLIQEMANAKGIDVSLEKVSDIGEILGYGVMSTPGVVLDGQVVHAGGIPQKYDIEAWLSAGGGAATQAVTAAVASAVKLKPNRRS